MRKTMKEFKVKVISPFRGLHEGDELVYNYDNKMFEFRETDEVVAEHFQSKNSKLVSFSASFVEKFLDQYFEDLDYFFAPEPVEEKEAEEDFKYSLDVTKIQDLVELLENLQKEVEELKKDKNKKVTRKIKK